MSFSVRGLTDSSVIVPAASERSPSDSLCVHDSGRVIGGDRSSSAGVWAVEFDGPWHFLTSRAPNGATLLKRRHLELLGHALVSVPDWEWYTLRKGSGDREQYLRGKLEASPGRMTHTHTHTHKHKHKHTHTAMPAHGMAPPQMMMMQPGQDGMSTGWQRGSMNNQLCSNGGRSS